LTERQSAGPYLVVATGAVLSLVLVMVGLHPVIGVPLAGAFFMLGALCRLIMSDARAGMLVMRGKMTDVVTLGLIGALLMFGGLILLVPRTWIVG
jgi:hypothetical protein